jgi:hypothetical protein
MPLINSFAVRILGVCAALGLIIWGASVANLSAPSALVNAITGGSNSVAIAAVPTASPAPSPSASPTTTTTLQAPVAVTAAPTVRPFMATITNTCVPDPSLPKTYYAGTGCLDPSLSYTHYLVTLSTEVYKVVGYQPKMVQLGQETCGELALYDSTRVQMDVTQWLVAEQNPANARSAALSVLNAATKNLCPALRSKVLIP